MSQMLRAEAEERLAQGSACPTATTSSAPGSATPGEEPCPLSAQLLAAASPSPWVQECVGVTPGCRGREHHTSFVPRGCSSEQLPSPEAGRRERGKIPNAAPPSPSHTAGLGFQLPFPHPAPLPQPDPRWALAEDVFSWLLPLFGTSPLRFGTFPLPPASRALTPAPFSKP